MKLHSGSPKIKPRCGQEDPRIEILDKASEALPTLNRLSTCRTELPSAGEQQNFPRLVIPSPMIMFQGFRHHATQQVLTEQDQLGQAFLLIERTRISACAFKLDFSLLLGCTSHRRSPAFPEIRGRTSHRDRASNNGNHSDSRRRPSLRGAPPAARSTTPGWRVMPPSRTLRLPNFDRRTARSTSLDLDRSPPP
jgi:hypothetical protein